MGVVITKGERGAGVFERGDTGQKSSMAGGYWLLPLNRIGGLKVGSG
jgi:hypothetical protein